MNKYPWLPIWVKKAIWFCFYKYRGIKFNLPGPTSTTHPFGWITPLPKTRKENKQCV